MAEIENGCGSMVQYPRVNDLAFFFEAGVLGGSKGSGGFHLLQAGLEWPGNLIYNGLYI